MNGPLLLSRNEVWTWVTSPHGNDCQQIKWKCLSVDAPSRALFVNVFAERCHGVTSQRHGVTLWRHGVTWHDIVTSCGMVNASTKFWASTSNGSAVRALTDRQTDRHTHTDGTDSIPSTADAEGKDRFVRKYHLPTERTILFSNRVSNTGKLGRKLNQEVEKTDLS